MLKILHIIPNLKKGGAERLVIDIVTELSKKDSLSIQLVLFENNIEYDVKDIKQFISIISSSVQLSLSGKNKYNVKGIQEFIDQFQPDVIHTHLFEAEIVSRSCFYPKAKWFSHCHDNMVQFKNFNLQTLFNKKDFTNYYEKKYLFRHYKKNKGNKFIAVSKNTKSYFEQTSEPYETILIPNSINYKRFYQIRNPKSDTNILKLINVGSFYGQKNQSFLIEVGNHLKLKHVYFELHFLGDGKNRNEIERKIKEYELQKHIFLHGNIEKVEEYLWKSDLYLHSSTSESSGLVLIEAMAAGIPVITLDGKGNRDLIEQGKNGYMLFENDSKKFANTIINLWNDKSKYQEMSGYAQEFAKQFDIINYCEKLLALYTDQSSSI